VRPYASFCLLVFHARAHHCFPIPLFPPSELQGQSSTAIISEMRDSLIDNCKYRSFYLSCRFLYLL
jgi:hypothetical protein